jgi:hypothetical protein
LLAVAVEVNTIKQLILRLIQMLEAFLEVEVLVLMKEQ